MNLLSLFKKLLFLFLALCIPAASLFANANTPTPPASFFGFEPGADRKMFGYDALIDYLRLLETQSGRIKLLETGSSELGKPMYIAFISSEKNIKELDHLREINRRLALDSEIPHSDREEMIAQGKVFVFATLSMHANEVGPSQAAPLMAYDLITERDPGMGAQLENVVFMMNPSHNPDGMDMIVNHYNRYLGTPFEGSSLPGVYHRYVGHNINRDFITLTQKENQAIADAYNLEWYPHVLVEKHQMGMTGVRYFVPPNHDPIAQNIDETLWGWTWVFGSNMARDMTAKGLTGVSQSYLFDNYWPGSTETSMWKNVISLLTEAASVKLASPVYIDQSELQVSGKGISEYKKGINFLAPWPGGWWTLGDIVAYEIESMYSMINTASLYREEILRFRNDLCIKEVNRGKTEAPYFYVVPRAQHDFSETVRMLELLKRHGVDIYTYHGPPRFTSGIMAEPGDYVIPMAQAYRPFIKEVLERQSYPVRRYTPGGEIIRPYDITSWSLPLHMGVNTIEIKEYGAFGMHELSPVSVFRQSGQLTSGNGMLLLDSRVNQHYKLAFNVMGAGMHVYRAESDFIHEGRQFPAGSFLIEVSARNMAKLNEDIMDVEMAWTTTRPIASFFRVNIPRILICETNQHDMDAGWTRWLFDQYKIPYEVMTPAAIASTDLEKKYDVIVFPDSPRNQLIHGRIERGGQTIVPFYNPEYIKGMGNEGWQKVIRFIDKGGKVISWARSSDLFTGLMDPGQGGRAFNFPFDNVANGLERQGLNIPGSFLNIRLDLQHPLCYGMPQEVGVFQRSNPVFATSVPLFDTDRKVTGRFSGHQLLLSGYAEKEELLENRPAMVWMQKGKGQVVLYSFAPNFRGSTPVNNKLIFNALLLK